METLLETFEMTPLTAKDDFSTLTFRKLDWKTFRKEDRVVWEEHSKEEMFDFLLEHLLTHECGRKSLRGFFGTDTEVWKDGKRVTDFLEASDEEDE